MADIDAKREARNRRILQNSENRLNRVLGINKNKPDIDNDVSQESFTSKATDGDVKFEDNEGNIDNTSMDVRNRRVIIANQHNLIQSPDTDRPLRNTVKISPLKRPVNADKNTKINESLNTSTTDAKMMLKHFEFLRIVLCFIVAYLCRRVLASGYGIFYIESVIVPFACLEAVFLTFKHKVLHNVTLPHRSSMLIGVLMLCGIKPRILQLYNQVMGYCTAAGEDFAMFFFAFMMSSLVVS